MDEIDVIIEKITGARDHLDRLIKANNFPHPNRRAEAREAAELLSDAIECLIPF